MNSNPSFSRYTMLWIVILCYLLPLISLSAYSTFTSSWNVLSLGLLVATLGSLAIFWMATRLEMNKAKPHLATNLPNTATPIFEENALTSIDAIDEKAPNILQLENELAQAQQTILNLREELDFHSNKNQQTLQEKEQIIQQTTHTLAEWEEYRKNTCQQLEQQQMHIQQLQEAIAEQKTILEKKQQQTGMLESKVGDLTYEIKTLLQLAEGHSSSIYSENPSSASSPPRDYPSEEIVTLPAEKQIRSGEEASLLLKRCLDIAQKITGSYRFNNQMHTFLESPADSFALDLRRLCDSLRSENSSIILLYSPKENQLLFANNQVKIVTGWSPDKFVQNFSEILQEEILWRQGISSLAMRSEAQVKLSFKTKGGQEVPLFGHLGIIPTGIFRQHVIAVLYQKT